MERGFHTLGLQVDRQTELSAQSRGKPVGCRLRGNDELACLDRQVRKFRARAGKRDCYDKVGLTLDDSGNMPALGLLGQQHIESVAIDLTALV